MMKHQLIAGLQLCLVVIAICSHALAYEDQNMDGVIVRLCPPPGREWQMKPDSTWVQVCTGDPFRDFFLYPDDWDVTRSVIDYFGYTSWILNDRFTDNELSSYFTQMNSWGLNFDLGVIAIKDISGVTTGEQCYNVESTRWERFADLGADISSLSIDEPFTATVRGNLQSSSMPPLSALGYAVRETADWLELTRADSIMGGSLIALIETYPYLEDEGESITEFVDSLQAECVLRDIEGIDALVIDYNWGYNSQPIDWYGLLDIQEHCDNIGLPFSLIFWPSRSWQAYPVNDDEDFHTDIMYQARLFFNVYGGSLDIVDVTAWDYIPRQMVPESYTTPKPETVWPFTWSFLDFYTTYIDDDKTEDFTHYSQNHCESIVATISPNPARSTIAVRFSTPDTETPVHLEVLDLAGRVVRNEQIRIANQGTNSFTWDACDNTGSPLSTGVYFVRLSQNGVVSSSSRLLLLK